MLTKVKFAQMIDHVLPKPFASIEEIKKGCQECTSLGLKTLSVHPVIVPMAARFLHGTKVGIEATTGCYWSPVNTTDKVSLSRNCIKAGATEIDTTLNLKALKSKDYKAVVHDINEVVKAVGGSIVKVVVDNHYLTKEEIVTAVKLCEEAGAHFIKTSVAFGSADDLLEDIILMRKVASDNLEIKVVGDIATFADFMKLYEAGITRCGTNKSLKIMSEYTNTQTLIA